MLTDQKAAGSPAQTTHHAPAADALDQLICYFEGQFVPMADAKVSIMTHAFMYGTATFEGIRAYWNEEEGVLYGLKLREHVERLRQSCRILLMRDVPSVVRFGNLHGVSTCPLTASGVEYVTYVQDTGFLAQDEKSPLLILTRSCSSSRSRARAAPTRPRRSTASCAG